VFTVDLPVPGARYRDLRSGLSGASGAAGSVRRLLQIVRCPGWAWDVGLRGGPHVLGNVAPMLKGRTGLLDFFGWVASNFDPSITWADLDWIRAEWNGPLLIKGVLDPEDAREAVRLGADGIVVSNHGGRQLDGAISTIRALPRVREAVGDRLTVLADGGVRSGLDVVRMLASGAEGVMIGRAWVNALAVDGGAGVSRVLDLIAAEMKVAMALAGVTRIDQITPDLLDRTA
jgi:L-lactate dehydrogenase (cytochrome)